MIRRPGGPADATQDPIRLERPQRPAGGWAPSLRPQANLSASQYRVTKSCPGTSLRCRGCPSEASMGAGVGAGVGQGAECRRHVLPLPGCVGPTEAGPPPSQGFRVFSEAEVWVR